MKRNKPILIISIFIALVSCSKELPQKPNILFITTDYQAWEDVPDLTPVLKMPALDKLYREGVVFENHYCTAPVCMPSRYSIVTGTYPHSHGAWDNTNQWVAEGSPILMEELGKAGYKTIGIGKMHFKPWDRMAGFNERIIADAQGNWAGDTLKKDAYYYYLKSAGKTRFDYLKYQDSTDIFGVYDWPLNDTLDIDYFVGNETVKYIDQEKLPDSPWFLWVSFNGPHNPWDPPKEYMDYYLDQTLPPARYLEGELDTKPFAHTITRYNYTRKVVDKIDQFPENRESYIKRIRAGHYGGLTWIDSQIQTILDKLQEKGKLDNTVVIFSSDHGAHLGDHDLIHKGTLYERSSHVPLVIWWPEALKPKRVKGFTSHIDLFPTLIDLAGGEKPASLEGKSYYELLSGKESAPDTAIIEILGNTALVTKDYKFGLYRQFKEGDLYDRRRDPDEFNNLINQAEYSDLVKELRDYLFRVDPTLEHDYLNAPAVKLMPAKIELRQGESVAGKNCPYLGGESFRIEIDMETIGDDSGPIVTHYEGAHGFAIYIDDGILMAGFRKWNKDQIITIAELDEGNHKIIVELTMEGVLKLTDNIKAIGEWETIWPKPLQPGRKEYISGNINFGTSGPAGAKPIGTYKAKTNFSGKIERMILTVNR